MCIHTKRSFVAEYVCLPCLTNAPIRNSFSSHVFPQTNCLKRMPTCVNVTAPSICFTAMAGLGCHHPEVNKVVQHVLIVQATCLGEQFYCRSFEIHLNCDCSANQPHSPQTQPPYPWKNKAKGREERAYFEGVISKATHVRSSALADV